MLHAPVLLLLTFACVPLVNAGLSLTELVRTSTKNPPEQTRGSTASFDESCVCVPAHLCNDDDADTGGVGLIDVRLKEDDITPNCANSLEICCFAPTKPETPKRGAPLTPDKVAGCGRRNPGGVDFRITGEEGDTAFGEFPWMVAVLMDDGKHTFKCGGSLIHPQVVMTAAHCVRGKGKFLIRAGEWDTQTEDELYQHQEVSVSSVAIHAQYYVGGAYNDIALLFLERPVTLGGNVDIVCLPEPFQNFDFTNCYVTGWGKTEFGKEGRHSVIMKKVQVPVVPRDACEINLRKTRLGERFKLHKSFLCAGGESGKDACEGDGGSPLVCPISDTEKYAQAGIVSWGVGCGAQDIPGVYANVPFLRDWIDQQFDERNLDTSYLQ